MEDARPIPFSAADLERRRLETTIDHDLHSLSLTTITSSATQERDEVDPYAALRGARVDIDAGSDTSFSSLSTIEYPRAETQARPHIPLSDMSFIHPHQQSSRPKMVGPHGTPRAQPQQRKISERSLMEASPISTADHHVSAVTLADAVFARPMGAGRRGDDPESGSEWDPDRSLGRLVGELGKVMQGQVINRPTSPFSPTRSPRSPSPFTSSQLNPNLSFTLNRADPLPSPPASRAGSRSGSGSSSASKSRTAQPARKALGESTVHNIAPPAPAQRKVHVGETPKPKQRLAHLHDQNRYRPMSAPVPRGVGLGDVTGMTGLMETPDKGLVHGLIGRNDEAGPGAADGVPDTLSALHARLRALETENSVSRRRVRELEEEVERAKAEVESARSTGQGRLQEVLGEKTALEDLVKSLRNQLSRLTVELEQHKAIVAQLRSAQDSPPTPASPPRSTVAKELISLRKEVERLSTEVHRLGGIVEQGLETRKRARGEETIRLDRQQGVTDLISLSDEEVQRVQKDVERRSTRSAPAPRTQTQTQALPSKLRQGTHRVASPEPELIDPSVLHPTIAEKSGSPGSDTSHGRSKHRSQPTKRQDGPSSPFPSIREEDEADFFDVSRRAQFPSLGQAATTASQRPKDHRARGEGREEADLPPQTVLTRVIGELEQDFKHYKLIYSELAEQYKILDAASAVAKRHILAEHLKEVIDTLEQKADQISSLYGLLSYRDRPDFGPSSNPKAQAKAVPDILRMVRDTLGEEGMRRLEEDGVFPKYSRSRTRTTSAGK